MAQSLLRGGVIMVKKLVTEKNAKAPAARRRSKPITQHDEALLDAHEPKKSTGLCPRCKGMELRNKHRPARKNDPVSKRIK